MSTSGDRVMSKGSTIAVYQRHSTPPADRGRA
jgi:hypothetical protein